MNRRGFLASLAGAVLAVAIDLRLSHVPEFVHEREEDLVLYVEEVDHVRKIVTVRSCGRVIMQSTLPADGYVSWGAGWVQVHGT